MIGRTLDNRYEILDRIGSGGMAIVYKAQDNYLNRTVAVKVLRQQFSADEEFVRRFRREAQSAASLSHPNIVNVYDVGTVDDTHYIVMEFIQGETLKQLIQRNGKLPVSTSLRIAYQICNALCHAHQRSIIHRDIKPHNILITEDGRVKVTDFGIARATNTTATNTGAIMGSVHYFSPEQARGGFTGEKSDVYSLGVVMYEMLIGRVPFEGDSPITIALKHVQEDIVPLSKIDPAMPEQVDHIVNKALEKSQSLRYQSSAEMLSDIRKALKNHSGEQSISGDDGGDDIVAPMQDVKGPAKSKALTSRDEPVKRKTRAGFVLAAGLLIVAFLVFGGVWLFMDWLNVPTIPVPSVVGKSHVEAQRTIIDAGLVPVVVAEKYDDTTPVSHIISQDPAAGHTLKSGGRVNLVISKGQEYTTVPDVAMRTIMDASVILNSARLEVGSIANKYHPSVPLDYIISQNPKARTQVPKDTMVDVEVSLGPEPVKTLTPSLVGQHLDVAKTIISGENLVLGEIIPRDSQEPVGIVLEQEPAAQTEVQEGTTVNLIISNGLSSGSTKVKPITIQVPRDRTGSVKVKVTLHDTRSLRTLYDDVTLPGSEIKINAEWYGQTARLKVYFDDTLAREQVLK